MQRLLVLGILCVALAGCSAISNSRLNPLNWFGRDKNEAAAYIPSEHIDPALTDPRPLIAQVSALEVERAAGGAIVRATGIAPTQGYFGAELVPLADETPVNGALVYFFRVEAPPSGQSVGSDRTRTITVARFVPDSVLSQARSIVVRGDGNQRRSSR